MFKFVKVVCVLAIVASSVSIYLAVAKMPEVEYGVKETSDQVILGHRVTKSGQFQLVTRR